MNPRKLLILAATVVAVFLLAGGVFLCRAPVPGGEVWIHFTAGIAGQLEPCGCDPLERGGQSRRIAFFEEQARRPRAHLALDVGDFMGVPRVLGFLALSQTPYLPEGMRRLGKIKNRAILAGLAACRYDAMGLGEKDFLLGQAYIHKESRAFKLPITSANIAYSHSEKLLYTPYRIVTVGQGSFYGIPYGGVRIGIFSLLYPTARLKYTAEDVNPIRPLPLTPAAESVVNLLRQESCDLVLCLFLGTEQNAVSLARQVPGIDVMLVGRDWNRIRDTSRYGDTILAGVPAEGRFVGELVLSLGPEKEIQSAAFRAVPMLPDSARSLAGARIHETYLAALKDASLMPDQLMDASEPYAGSGPCLHCHPTEHEQWSGTPHARAMTVLRDKSQDANPECLQCHTTGYGKKSGFGSIGAAQELGGVGCEICHGPRSLHVKKYTEQEKAGRLTLPLMDNHRKRPLATGCTQCHTAQRDRHFEKSQDLRFERIRHRPEKTGK